MIIPKQQYERPVTECQPLALEHVFCGPSHPDSATTVDVPINADGIEEESW